MNRSSVFSFDDAQNGRKKTAVLASALVHFALDRGIRITARDCDVRLSSELPFLLDADFIVSLVDDARPRHLLNRLAYAHYIPVLDGGNVICRLSQPIPPCFSD